jgi:DnaJ like chaperone protein
MLFVVAGGLLGLIMGGLNGLIVGIVLGYGASYAVGYVLRRGLSVVQSTLVDSIFSVMGALCKADSVVTRDEIDAVERVFGMLRLSDEQRKRAKAAFNRGKQPDFDLDAAVDDFRKVSAGRAPLINLFLQLQTMAIAADGRIDPAEHEMLVRVGRRLGLGERDVAQLEALLRAAGGGTSAAPASARLDDAYTALGVAKDATDAEVKRAYRRLISQNHPDKLAARGLPESMRAVAEERSRELNAAYDLIKEARGIP